MNIQKYVLRFGAAGITFVMGLSVYGGYRFVTSHFPKWPPPAAGLSVNRAAYTRELNLSSEYYLFDETLVEGFQDFNYLELETRVYDPDKYWKPVPPRGFVHIRLDLPFSSVSVSPGLITFETETVHGISYTFTGRTVQTGDDLGGADKIRGTLKKLVNDNVVASMDVVFYPRGR